MSIEEAIEHCKEQAKVCSIKKCADDHLQLAEWLEELKELRKLFTLTAEEVEKAKPIIEYGLTLLRRDYTYRVYHTDDWNKDMDFLNNLLTRIKQWQDEQN